MSKIAFLYPGQGAQVVGMGKDFYENSPEAGRVYDLAASVLDFDLKKICFEDNELINRTDYTQPAMVATCLAMTAVLESMGVKPDLTAGLSLGEYAAITTAGGMDMKDAIKTVRQRGIYMQNAVPDGTGAMAAVFGMTGAQVAEVISDMEGVYVANYNCPGQIVITGDREAVAKAGDRLKAAGGKRIIPLNVSGPFHSPLLKEAGDRLAVDLAAVNWTSLKIPYVSNVHAQMVHDINDTAELLKRQVSSSVLWEDSMRMMLEHGVDTFIEIGPGRTLSGFMKKIDRSAQVLRVNTWEDLNQFC